jgi:hypothetical protein
MSKKLTALLVAGAALMSTAPPAYAGTQKCHTEVNVLDGRHSVTTCDIYGDDGSWTTTQTYCNTETGDCSTS